MITNKPVHGAFEAGFNAKYGATKSGADSGAVDAYVNVPFSDQFAARLAVYSDNQGGWIDNVPATFTPSGEVIDRNNAAGYGPYMLEQRADGYPDRNRPNTDSVMSARNDGLVQDNWNEATYRGARLALSYDINEDWNALVQHTAQTLETEGSFTVEPEPRRRVLRQVFPGVQPGRIWPDRLDPDRPHRQLGRGLHWRLPEARSR